MKTKGISLSHAVFSFAVGDANSALGAGNIAVGDVFIAVGDGKQIHKQKRRTITLCQPLKQATYVYLFLNK